MRGRLLFALLVLSAGNARAADDAPWKAMFAPKTFGNYINDHSLFQDADGGFRVLGISSLKDGGRGEVSFIEGVAENPFGPFRETRSILAKIPHRGPKLAPHIVQHEGRYYLFFGPKTIWRLSSVDGVHWEDPRKVIRGSFPGLRDPMVLRIGSGFLLYATDWNNRVSVYESTDLSVFRKCSEPALTVSKGYPRSLNSSPESPFVLPYNGQYYLFTTIVPGQLQRGEHLRHYNNTIVVRSKNPRHFGRLSTGVDNTAVIAGRVFTHAPEIFAANGRLYITSAGWRNRPRPQGVSDGILAVRELHPREFGAE